MVYRYVSKVRNIWFVWAENYEANYMRFLLVSHGPRVLGNRHAHPRYATEKNMNMYRLYTWSGIHERIPLQTIV